MAQPGLENFGKRKYCDDRSSRVGNSYSNHGWVECRSRRHPNRCYYFNVRSHCTTWSRPVSKRVQLPIFTPKPAFLESTLDNEPPMIVSDNEMGQTVSRKRKRKIKMRSKARNNSSSDEDSPRFLEESKFFEILSRLYYCPKEQPCVGELHLEEDPKNYANPPTNFLELHYSDGRSTDGERSSTSSQTSTESYSCSCSCSSSSDTVITKDGFAQVYSTSPSEDDSNSGTKFIVPRVKPILPEDLLVKEKKRRRVRRKIVEEDAEVCEEINPNVTVREMYGITTVNYDPPPQKLPVGVKLDNLSESSLASSQESRESENCLPKCPSLLGFGAVTSLGVKEPILSDPDSDD